MIGWVFEDHLK